MKYIFGLKRKEISCVLTIKHHFLSSWASLPVTFAPLPLSTSILHSTILMGDPSFYFLEVTVDILVGSIRSLTVYVRTVRGLSFLLFPSSFSLSHTLIPYTLLTGHSYTPRFLSPLPKDFFYIRIDGLDWLNPCPSKSFLVCRETYLAHHME